VKTRELIHKQYARAVVATRAQLRITRVLFTTAAVCLSVFMINTVGCAMPNEDEAGDLTVLKQGLASKPFFGETQCSGPHKGYFDNGSTIDLCFTGPGSVSDQNLVKVAIDETWAIATSLVFRWNGTCPTPIPSSWMSIYIARVNNGGDSASGPGNRLTTNCVGGDGTDLSAHWEYRSDIQSYVSSPVGNDGFLQQVAVHEFIHTLGFYHEHDRADSYYETGLCTDEHANGVPDGYLTQYDPVSVANYCGSIYGRKAGDYSLTPLDILGAEIIYPRSFSHPIRAPYGFYTGSGLVVRSDDVLLTDWIHRGASEQVFLPSGVDWYRGSPSDPAHSTVYPFQYSTSLLVKDTTTAVQGVHFDTMSRTHTDVGMVIASNSLHTAILLSVL
jgi:hypothetical protein